MAPPSFFCTCHGEKLRETRCSRCCNIAGFIERGDQPDTDQNTYFSGLTPPNPHRHAANKSRSTRAVDLVYRARPPSHAPSSLHAVFTLVFCAYKYARLPQVAVVIAVVLVGLTVVRRVKRGSRNNVDDNATVNFRTSAPVPVSDADESINDKNESAGRAR